MKSRLFCLLHFAIGLLICAGAAGASPVLLETHQTGVLAIPEKQSQTLDVVSINFQVDTACFVQVNAGGNGKRSIMSLAMDGTDLFPEIQPSFGGFSIPYASFVSAGDHVLTLKFTNYGNYDEEASCQDSYLQALIFLPDEPSAVAEQLEPRGLSPLPVSIISHGPWVSAPGATELYDANGRKVSDVPQDGRICLQDLPGGTYFAREGDTRTMLKIVKIQ